MVKLYCFCQYLLIIPVIICSSFLITKPVIAFTEEFNLGFDNENAWSIESDSQQPTFLPSSVLLESDSNVFPYFRSVDGLLDNESEIEIRFRYRSAGTEFGDGFAFTDYVPQYQSNMTFPVDFINYSIFYIWHNRPSPYTFHLVSSLCPESNSECSMDMMQIFHNKTVPDYDWHTVRVLRDGSNIYSYYFYFDGTLAFKSTNTARKINNLWFGNPSRQGSGTWSILEVDYVRTNEDIASQAWTFPYLSQNDPMWGQEEYDHASEWVEGDQDDIGRWGCALTSAAMVLKNYDIKNATDGATVNPSLLNSWLTAQTDGYIRGGLLNWLSVARFAKESRVAGKAPTALEFERKPYATNTVETALTNETPVILSEPGHFVTAYLNETDQYVIADPNDTSRTALPKTHPFITANIYNKSDTDLSYFLFVKDNEIAAELTDEAGETIPLWFQREFPSTAIETAYLPKMLAGKYKLKLTGKADSAGYVDVFLYDMNGNPEEHKLQIPAATSIWYEINYNPHNLASSTVTKLDSIPPISPRLVSPTNNSWVTGNPTQTWTNVADAHHYIYQSSYDANFSNLIYTTDVPGTLRTVGGIQTINFYWRVKAVDAAGNESPWSEVWKLNLDNAAPTKPTGLKRTSKDGNKIYQCGDYAQRQTLIPTWDNMALNDPSFDHYEYASFTPNGSIGTEQVLYTNKFVHNWIPTTDGTNGYTVRSVDKVGKVSDWALTSKSLTGSCQITYDSTAPNIPLLRIPVDGSSTRGIAFDQKWYKVEDTVGYEYQSCYVDPGDTGENCLSVKYTQTFAGVNNTTKHVGAGQPNSLFWWRVRAKDIAGNYSNWSESRELIIDNNAPISTITYPSNTQNGQSVISNSWDGNISGTATDSASAIAWVELSIYRASDSKYWNGAQWIVGTESSTRVTASGSTYWTYLLNQPADDTYTITSHAVDEAGNVENSYMLTIILDKTIPQVSLNIAPVLPNNTNGWYVSIPYLTLSATDTNYDKIEYQWGSKNSSWSKYLSTLSPSNEGAHTLYYRAWDKAGNVSEIGNKTVYWDQTAINTAPKITDVHIESGEKSAIVSWEAAQDNVGIAKYEVQWWKDSAYKYTDSVGSGHRSHTIDNLIDGSWTVVVRAFDGPGNTAASSNSFTLGAVSSGNVLGASIESDRSSTTATAKTSNYYNEDSGEEVIGDILGENTSSSSTSLQPLPNSESQENVVNDAINKWWIVVLAGTGALGLIWLAIYLIKK